MLLSVKRVCCGAQNTGILIPRFFTPIGSRRAPSLPIERGGSSQKPLPFRSRLRYFSSRTSPLLFAPLPKPDRTSPEFTEWALSKLPLTCPGCGAPTQTVDKTQPGYFNLRTHAVVKFLGLKPPPKKKGEDEIVRQAIKRVEHLNLGLEYDDSLEDEVPTIDSVKCHRCRNILNHRTEIPIAHPSIESIRDTIDETPYKYNHIYHVIDAADFPMSLVPGLQRVLNTTPLRSKNRRSKSEKFYHGRNTEMSFIITRSDLLAPLKEQVDAMMPYLRNTLRDALGRSATDMRLGNVRCVSAKRGWWTRELKEEVWNRGGAGWMVGKINVGKSQLFSSIYPKGKDVLTSNEPFEQVPSNTTNLEDPKQVQDDTTEAKTVDLADTNDVNQTQDAEKSEPLTENASEKQIIQEEDVENLKTGEVNSEFFNTELLLPPLPPEHQFPLMPTVSDLPGTTASPIRLSFGKGKGELIDLPGLERGDLAKHVLPKYRKNLVMLTRIVPEQQVIKPGQSLLLGGFIRITPTCPEIVILSYAFTPIEPHVTSTEKAIGTQHQVRISSLMDISAPGTGKTIASAGRFLLKWDVTKKQTGPVTAHDAGRVSVDQLPYRVLATEILIEGCGWVELVAQVSKERGSSTIRPLNSETDSDESDLSLIEKNEDNAIDQKWPGVEVFTPCGKYVAARRPLSAWHIVSNKPSKIKHARPRAAVAGRR